jgi:hypothetical protein
MTAVTVLEYKGVTKRPSEPHTMTWLEYVQLMHKLEALETRVRFITWEEPEL